MTVVAGQIEAPAPEAGQELAGLPGAVQLALPELAAPLVQQVLMTGLSCSACWSGEAQIQDPASGALLCIPCANRPAARQ